MYVGMAEQISPVFTLLPNNSNCKQMLLDAGQRSRSGQTDVNVNVYELRKTFHVKNGRI